MLFKSFQFCKNKFTFARMATKYTSVPNNTDSNVKILMELFGFSKEQAIHLFKQTNLQTKETGVLIESYVILKKLGLNTNDMLTYPSLLSAHPLTILNYYKTFQETGCAPINARLLCSGRRLIKNKISLLKNEGYLNKDVNVADQFLSYLDPPIEKPEVLKKDLNEVDKMYWSEVHRAVLQDWLKKRLNLSQDDLIKLFRIHKMIQYKSFRTINENITLAESLGLSHEKILKCGYILNNYPEYPKTVLKDYPFFAGIDMAKAYKANPKMMMINPRRILEIYDILKQYDITDEQIQKKPDIFTLSPTTLRSRLDDIQNIPTFQVLMNDPLMLKLVVHHIKIKSRLDFMHKLNLRCANLGQISNLNSKSFEDYIHLVKDANRPQSVITFFCRLLDKSKEDVEGKLKQHPYYCNIPFEDINTTFQYLKQQGYTKMNIFRCLLILLYPRTKIQESIKQLKRQNRLRFSELTQRKQLNLILYHMEKRHHFTGNGVWTTGSKILDEEKTLE